MSRRDKQKHRDRERDIFSSAVYYTVTETCAKGTNTNMRSDREMSSIGTETRTDREMLRALAQWWHCSSSC